MLALGGGAPAVPFDPVELRVRQASELAHQLALGVVSELGDARAIARPDGYADAVLRPGRCTAC